LKPEDEDRFAESAQVAVAKLESGKTSAPPTASAAPIKAPTNPQDKTAEAIKPPLPSGPAAPMAVTISAAAPVSAKTEVAPAVATVGAALPEADSAKAKPAGEKSETPDDKSAAIAGIAAELFEPAITQTEPVQPELTLGQSERELVSHRQWVLVLLICIVVGTAFAAGVWWKLKTAQIGGQMVQTQPTSQSSRSGNDGEPLGAATNSNSSIASSSNSEPAETASTAQELSKFPKVTGVRHWSSTDSSTIVLDLEDQVQYEPGHLSNPDRFYFDLRDTQLSPGLEGKSFDGDTLLNRIRIAQPAAGMTRVVLEARPGAALSRPQVSLERDPYRLVIEVSKAGASPKGAVNLFPNTPDTEKNKATIVIPPPTKEDLQLRARTPKMRIVVDAGHGGWDLGTVGRRGLLEKDLVLEIAQRLGKLLESRLGSEVIYTRQDDNYIPLDDRALMANQAQADLFISVHANYSDLPSARGVETYYTSLFSAPGSKDAALKDIDTGSVAGTLKNAAGPTLSGAELQDRIEHSRHLAASVQRSLYGTLSVQNPGLRDRGIKEAGFVVLTESAMPGILAEVSFVSSPTDEQKLRTDGYREQIAEALYRGIARYAASSRAVKVASAAK
jgi:N-acetylmuramoyl-L-alanine amidase